MRTHSNTTERAVELLADLVAFPTVSRGSNEPLISYIEEYLSGCGLSPRRIYGSHEDRFSLFACIAAAGAGAAGRGVHSARGLLLSGHTDVVPAQPEQWTGDPFLLRSVAEGEAQRLYGRGSTDMKGFLACLLALVPSWMEKRSRHSATGDPLYLAFTYDEEIGCVGVDDLIAELGRSLPRPEAVIVGEPTECRPLFGHKGAAQFRTTVTGAEAHSSRPDEGTNAIYFAAEIVRFLRSRADTLRRNGAGGEHGTAKTKLHLFDPPHSTLSVGMIHGGTARNIVAGSCEIIWEIRNLPGEDPMEILKELESFVEELGPAQVQGAPRIETVLESSYPGLITEKESPVLRYYCRMTGEKDEPLVAHEAGQPRQDERLPTAPFGTEAGKYAAAGISALVWGPGSIAQAHRKDEYIERSQIERCLTCLARL